MVIVIKMVASLTTRANHTFFLSLDTLYVKDQFLAMVSAPAPNACPKDIPFMPAAPARPGHGPGWTANSGCQFPGTSTKSGSSICSSPISPASNIRCKSNIMYLLATACCPVPWAVCKQIAAKVLPSTQTKSMLSRKAFAVSSRSMLFEGCLGNSTCKTKWDLHSMASG